MISKIKSGVVHCIVPKAGLGNQLFPIMHATLFAELNNLPLVFTGYHQVKIGVYFRKEKSKRKYTGFFNFQKSWVGELTDRVRIAWLTRNMEKMFEPEMNILPETSRNKKFIFAALPNSKYYFEKLKEHRDLVIKLFQFVLRPWIYEKLNSLQTPEIGVHIRMGDFRKLAENEVYNGGHVRTPESYYADIIVKMQEWNPGLKVSVFTDGFKDEFKTLLGLPKVEMVEGNHDVVDLLLLSKSKIIVGTYGSTFSYWAGFISDAPFIMHRFLKHSTVRPESLKAIFYEGPFEETDERLQQIVKELK